MNITGFPANTTLTGAHIHNAAAGTNAGVVVGLPLTRDRHRRGDRAVDHYQDRAAKHVEPPCRRRRLRRASSTTPPGNYFNVHTTVNGGGAIRGQLVKQN